MKYSSKHNGTKTRVSHKSLVGIAVAATILMIGVVTALSMQRGQTQKAQVEERNPQVASSSYRNYVTRDASGQTVVLDRQTGQSRPLTSEEASRLAEGLEQMLNQSTDGLVEVRHSDGSVSIDLQGRFQDVILAKKEADGTVSTACVNNVDSAAAFFEIDPALLGSKTPVSRSPGALNPIR